jgi:energy-coupling factor transporter ATP-binding protein EcfA2
MSVARNFVLAAEPTIGRGLFKRMDLAKASEIALARLKELGISRVTSGDQLVGTLSGGERQALAIARALHFGARVLVLDEPTAALGVRESATVLRLIDTVRARGVAVLFITHNAYHAYSVGDEFLILRRGEMLASFKQGRQADRRGHGADGRRRGTSLAVVFRGRFRGRSPLRRRSASDPFHERRSSAMISARIATAISAGECAPMARPIGAWMRARSVSLKPAAAKRSRRLACEVRLPSAPT